MKRPNILIFNPDQYRGDALAHMGNPAAVTPNFDRSCTTDAVSFRNAFCQNPVCTPSRCSFMSGWYPHVRGHRTMHYLMRPDEPVLLKTLKDQGYFVWWGGRNDLVPEVNGFASYCNRKHELSEGLDEYFFSDWRGDEDGDNFFSFYKGKLELDKRDVFYDFDWDHVTAAIEFIRNAPTDQPFCIYLPIVYPHPPYAVEDPWYSMIDRSKIPSPYPIPPDNSAKPSILAGIRKGQRLSGWTEARWKELKATYYGMCARVDHQFGLLLNALKETGTYDDTAVFVFSDHGDYTGDYGLVEKTQNCFEDTLTRIPFIIKPPAWIDVKPGVSDAMVELVDFSATVEALTGIAPEHTHFGKSLLPVLTGQQSEHRDAVFCEGGRLAGEMHCSEIESVLLYGEKMLYYPRLKLQIGDGPEHGKAVMVRTKNYKYVRRLYEKDELYDLINDPMELYNRIDDPYLSDVLTRLKERLLTFYVKTCDAVPHKTDVR